MASPPAGVLYLVATPLGNLEDITYRAVRLLGEVEIVAAEDTRTAERLLTHYGVRPPKLLSYFEGNEAARSTQLVEAMCGGKSVAVISEAGTPGVSDPGERLVRAAVAAGIRVEPVPGPVAAVAAVIASGLATSSFTFYGFPPRDTGARQELFGSLRATAPTLIFYESPKRLVASLQDLSAALGADRAASVAREVSKIHEEHVRGSLAELIEHFTATAPRGECTLVVAGAARGEQQVVDVEAEVRRLLTAGLGPRDVAARLVVKTGKPRRQLYQLALALQRSQLDISSEP